MSAPSHKYDYQTDFQLIDGISFYTVIQEINKQSPRIERHFISQWDRVRDQHGREFMVSLPAVVNGVPNDVHMKVLGMGENGIVYRLTIQNHIFVLKMVINHDPEKEPLVEEIEILKQLKDKWFALQLLASSALPATNRRGEDVHNIYLLYPYIEGWTLNDVLYSDYESDVIRSKLNDILKGLHELHQLGIVHNDIKADNIWIPADPDIKPFFIDFGGSSAINDRRTPTSNLRNLGMTVKHMNLRVSNNMLRTLQKKNVSYNNVKNMSFGGKRMTKKRMTKKRMTKKKVFHEVHRR